jgi:predicted nucleotidyltransferase
MRPASSSMELPSLFSEVKGAVLARLLLSDRQWYLRELARSIGLAHTTVLAELRGLVRAGIVLASRSGVQVYYTANKSSPIYPDLKNILIKTIGIAEPIKTALSPIAERINLAYIYGSFADGTARVDSDVDLMVVGQTSLFEIVSLLIGASATITRTINPTVFSTAEYFEELNRKEGFIYSIHNGARIVLMENIHEAE